MREILVTGATGLVGSKFLKLYPRKEELFFPRQKDLDITSMEAVGKYFERHEPNVVINFAAYTNVDGAEDDLERGKQSGQVWKINVEGPKNLAEVAKRKGSFLIHISTDFVFPGTSSFPGPYDENDNPNEGDSDSIGWYAKTKLMAERALLVVGGDTAIVRISYPFGNPESDKDFAVKIRKFIESDYSLVSDQKITPTYIPDLVTAITKIFERRLPGIYHVATNPVTTPYEFGEYLAQKLDISGEIKEGSLEALIKSSGKSPRSLLGGLETTHTEQVLGIEFRNWQEAIDDFVSRLGLA